MADLVTLGEIKAKIKDDTDINDEEFVADTTENPELMRYINEGIDDCEALIHGLYEDYFMTRALFPVVAGTKEYALPANIYGNKIRAMLYNDTARRRYEITVIEKLNEIIFLDDNTSDPDSYLKYKIVNDGDNPADYRVRYYPTPNVTSATNIELWYIRNATKFTTASPDTQVLDIPEFKNYIYAHVKWNIARKEKLPTDLTVASKHLSEQKRLMEDTLTSMIPDENNFVYHDIQFYNDFDDFYGGYHNW